VNTTDTAEVLVSTDTAQVLLVENNWLDAGLMMRSIKKSPFVGTVMWVHDGAEALEYLRRDGRYAGLNSAGRPLLMLLDLKMPKIDGLDLLRALQSTPRADRPAIVIITSAAIDADIAAAYDLGANSVILKPIAPAELNGTIADICRYWLQLNRSADL
jgi:two-component system response regulator